jgi:hypothetical protein
MVSGKMGFSMDGKLDRERLEDFKELLMSSAIQVDALVYLLIEKGLITKEEFFCKLEEVQDEYERRKESQINGLR